MYLFKNIWCIGFIPCKLYFQLAVQNKVFSSKFISEMMAQDQETLKNYFNILTVMLT